MSARRESFHEVVSSVRLLSLFFLIIALISGALDAALVSNSKSLAVLWEVNRQAEQTFRELGPRGVVFLSCVSVLCLVTAIGLWCHRRWGYRLAITLIVVNLIGDLFTLLDLRQPQAMITIIVATGMLSFLLTPAFRNHFHSVPPN